MENFKLTVEQLLQARKYDPNRQPQPEQVTLTIGGKKVGSLQNLVTLTGKQKNGKSRFTGATIASGVAHKEIFEIRLRTPHNRPRIALFDTEQSDYDFYKQMNAIKDFAGLDYLPGTFDAFNTREDDPHEQIKMICKYLEANPDCATVFIDGILDLLISFNDERESKNLINLIKRITKIHNCLIVGIMHRGKGNDLTLGHLGSMADRVAQSVLKVEKNKEKNSYCLSSDFMRSDEDFSPIEIWKPGDIWEQTFYTPQDENQGARIRPLKARPEDIPNEDYLQRRSLIFIEGDYLQYSQLTKAIQEVFGVGRNWAVDCIKHLGNENIIFRHPQGWSYKSQSEAKLFIES